MQGLSLTTIAILIANTLLLVSIFIAIEKTPTRVKVVNTATKKINKLYLVPTQYTTTLQLNTILIRKTNK